jgi:hypothetical protein
MDGLCEPEVGGPFCMSQLGRCVHVSVWCVHVSVWCVHVSLCVFMCLCLSVCVGVVLHYVSGPFV